MNYPELIENVSLNLARKNREIQELRSQLGIEESSMILEILNAKDEQGKALYSNETARNAAVKIVLSTNPTYQELETKSLDAEQERAELLANFECLRNEFKLFLLDKQLEIASKQRD